MYQKEELSWKQKSDLENRELLVVQSYNATSLKEAYRALLGNGYSSYERRIINSFDPFKLTSLVLKGYETPDFSMRQESNKIIIDFDALMAKLKISRQVVGSFWSLVSLQSETLLSAIESDLELISQRASKDNSKHQKILLDSYRVIKQKTQSYIKNPKFVEQVKMGF